MVFFFFITACEKENLPAALLTEESGVQMPLFNDSWGYLYAQNSMFPTVTDVDVYDVDYYGNAIVAEAIFLASQGNSKFSDIGGGLVSINGNALSNIMGFYMGGTTNENGLTWSVSGSSICPSFASSTNNFCAISGLVIPSWASCSSNEDLTVTIKGSTKDAYELYAECAAKPGVVYGDDKYLTKKLTPGATQFTITSAELQALKDYLSHGFTLYVYAFTYDTHAQDAKKYYMINSRCLQHAVYFAK